jgi:hypothetical protein
VHGAENYERALYGCFQSILALAAAQGYGQEIMVQGKHPLNRRKYWGKEV